MALTHKTKPIDVKKKVIDFLKKELEKADQEGLINFEEFRKYVIERSYNETSILTIPISILNECIDEAIREFKRFDNANK